jgi:hypothetical protein
MKLGLLLIYVNFLSPWSAVSAFHSDPIPDPGDSNQCGSRSGSETMLFFLTILSLYPSYFWKQELLLALCHSFCIFFLYNRYIHTSLIHSLTFAEAHLYCCWLCAGGARTVWEVWWMWERNQLRDLSHLLPSPGRFQPSARLHQQVRVAPKLSPSGSIDLTQTGPF